MKIAQNILRYQEELPASCHLIAVSKLHTVDKIMEAYHAGQRDFGENYIQELLEKKEQCPEDIRWHFIGHLQSNKVKYIAPFVHLIHAVDSEKLLKEINKQGAKNNRKIKVLLQIHIAQESSKFGFSKDEFKKLIENKIVDKYPQVALEGLMAMATNTEDLQQIEKEFESVKALKNWSINHYPNIKESSIGMSQDYKIAVKHGSTLVRLGTTIFGERP